MTQLPGVVRQLVEKGYLPPDTAGLAELELELPSNWWMLVNDRETCKQKGWPLRYDVEIACRAVARAPALMAPHNSWLAEVRAWLDRGDDTVVLEKHRTLISVMTLGSMLAVPGGSEAKALQALDALYPESGDVERRAFLQAGQQRPAETAVCFLVAAAQAAPDGWTAYHFSRGLPSGAAVQAAAAIGGLLRAGLLTGAEVVASARELAQSAGE